MQRLLSTFAAIAASILVPLFFLRDLFRRIPRQQSASRTLLCLSQVIFREVWQRPQEFVSRCHFDGTVIYCSPVQVHNWLFSLGSRWRSVEVLHSGRLIVLSPLIFPGHYKSRFLFKVNNALITRLVARYLGHSPTYVLINTPLAVPLLERLFWDESHQCNLEKLMYDIIDDFPAFSWAPKDSRELEKVLLQRSDCIITGTLALEKMHRATRPDARFIPCGVDFDLFHTPQIKPTMLEHVTKPIIGYFGTISERIDISLLKLIESEIPEASLVLIGPVHLGTSDLPHSSRIYYPGLIPHNQLAGFAQQFSVAIIPFCITEATNKLNPVKTLEYMAAGVPVVSTALPDIVQLFASYVSVAMDHEEFIAHIRRILKTPPVDQISAASKLARESSWQAMTDRILEFLEGTSRASIK